MNKKKQGEVDRNLCCETNQHSELIKDLGLVKMDNKSEEGGEHTKAFFAERPFLVEHSLVVEGTPAHF